MHYIERYTIKFLSSRLLIPSNITFYKKVYKHYTCISAISVYTVINLFSYILSVKLKGGIFFVMLRRHHIINSNHFLKSLEASKKDYLLLQVCIMFDSFINISSSSSIIEETHHNYN